MSTRRDFLKLLGSGIALSGLAGLPLDMFASAGMVKLTVLHTNDVHSRMDPFPENDPKWPGLGGIARRAALIRQIRQQEEHVLLLDAGDIFQGTPYFNLYGGEVELKAMSRMGYDASTLGNHDFDNGADGLARQMVHMNFPFVNANYVFDDSPLQHRINEYKIFRKGPLKIGVFGIGIELQGLVDPKMYGTIQYRDPVEHVKRISTILKHEHKCDLIICLSHLGYKYQDKKISDDVVAGMTEDIDLFIGGHTHTFLDEPVRKLNSKGKEVLIAQVGWAGIKLGRIDFYFDVNQRKKETVGATVKVSEKTIAT